MSKIGVHDEYDHRASPVTTLVVACLGFFLVLLDASIVTVALPTIQADLHAKLADLQWVVDAYTLPFAALLLTAGTLGDRYGRKRVFLAGLVLFLLGSTLCGFANTLNWFLTGRVIQGVGGAALSPGSLAVLVAAFPEPRAHAGHRPLVGHLWFSPGRRAARRRGAHPIVRLASDLFRESAGWAGSAHTGLAASG
jgi:MFS family permease